MKLLTVVLLSPLVSAVCNTGAGQINLLFSEANDNGIGSKDKYEVCPAGGSCGKCPYNDLDPD